MLISELIQVKNGAPASSYTTANVVTSIGAMVIECLTIISAVYLLIPLASTGQLGKLRGKLLVALVISDLLLGLVGAVSTAAFLAGYPLLANTPACDAHGFLLTTVLFTQHLWTLMLAIVTFFLLKYPIHFFTRTLDRYWWWIPVGIWGISALQSGLWYHFFGFAPFNGGTLCYYGAGRHKYDRDVLQFVPRAVVFLAIIILYSRLFTFLRRPDTIHISSLDWSSAELQSGLQSQIGTPKDNGGNSGWASVTNEDGGASRRPSHALAVLRLSTESQHRRPSEYHQKHLPSAPQVAPWEKLELEGAIGDAPKVDNLGNGDVTPKLGQMGSPKIRQPAGVETSPFTTEYRFGAGSIADGGIRTGNDGNASDDGEDVDPLSSRPSRWATRYVVPTLDHRSAPGSQQHTLATSSSILAPPIFPPSLPHTTASSFRSNSLDRRKSSVTFAALPSSAIGGGPSSSSSRLLASTSTGASSTLASAPAQVGGVSSVAGTSGSRAITNVSASADQLDDSSAGASSSTYVNGDENDTRSSRSASASEDEDDDDEGKGETLAEFFASTQRGGAGATSFGFGGGSQDDSWDRSRRSGAGPSASGGGGGGGGGSGHARRKSSSDPLNSTAAGRDRDRRRSRKSSLRKLLPLFGRRSRSDNNEDDDDDNASGFPPDDDLPRRSAASYFNRQAALLMLYFPLAYLVVFAFSLVRLIYDMATYKPSAALSALSLWFVLSAGLMDALVYGIAEYNVKRRVRRKMPEAFADEHQTATGTFTSGMIGRGS